MDYCSNPFSYANNDSGENESLQTNHTGYADGYWPEYSNFWMDFYPQFNWITSGVCTIILFLFGVAGNVYSLYLINWNIKMRNSIGGLLSVLAVWDMTFLFGIFFYYGLPSIFTSLVTQHHFLYTAWLLHPVMCVCTTSSLWMVMIITSERHYAIWRPVIFKMKDTKKRVRGICFVVAIASVTFNLPRFFELKLVKCFFPWSSPGSHETRLVPTAFWNNVYYNILYRVIAMLIFNTIAPFLYTMILTMRMIRILRQSLGKLDSSSETLYRRKLRKKRRRSESIVTRMLIFITAKFLFCYTCPTFLNIWESYNLIKYGFTHTTLPFLYLIDLCNLMVAMNSATNFIIFFLCRKKLRKAKNMIRLKASLFAAVAFSKHFKKPKRPSSDTPDLLQTPSCSPMPFRSPALSIRSSFASPSSPTSVLIRQSTLETQSLVENESAGDSDDEYETAHFTVAEAKTFRRTWDSIKEKEIGERVLHELLLHNPKLKEQAGDDGLIAKAAQVTEVLGNLVYCAGEKTLERKIGQELSRIGAIHAQHGVVFTNADWRHFKAAIVSAAGASRRRPSSSVQFNVASSISSTRYLEKAESADNMGFLKSDYLNVESQQETGMRVEECKRAWNRLACFIILKMKHGKDVSTAKKTVYGTVHSDSVVFHYDTTHSAE